MIAQIWISSTMKVDHFPGRPIDSHSDVLVYWRDLEGVSMFVCIMYIYIYIYTEISTVMYPPLHVFVDHALVGVPQMESVARYGCVLVDYILIKAHMICMNNVYIYIYTHKHIYI